MNERQETFMLHIVMLKQMPNINIKGVGNVNEDVMCFKICLFLLLPQQCPGRRTKTCFGSSESLATSFTGLFILFTYHYKELLLSKSDRKDRFKK